VHNEKSTSETLSFWRRPLARSKLGGKRFYTSVLLRIESLHSNLTMMVLRLRLRRVHLRHFAVMLCWTTMFSAIVLNALYRDLVLNWFDWILLLAVCLFAGAVIVDIDVVVLGFFSAFLLSLLVIFLCLSLPAMLGVLQHIAQREALYQWAVVLVARTLVPLPLMYCFAASLVGAFLRERLV